MQFLKYGNYVSTPPLDLYPTLKAHLSKAKADRIRYLNGRVRERSRTERVLTNPILTLMQYQRAYSGNDIDDIIVGVARLDHHSNTKGRSLPLSVNRLYNILQCMQEISTPDLCEMLDVETRQAQKYLKAVKIIIFHVTRHINSVLIEGSLEEDLDNIEPSLGVVNVSPER